MATLIIMPRQGQSVESCILDEWHKKVGDPVRAGDVLFTYETDKAVFDETSPVDGTLLACFYGEDEDVPCLQTVCAIGQEGEEVPFPTKDEPPASGNAPETLIPNNQDRAVESAIDSPSSGTDGPESGKGASPRAKRLAERMDVEIEKLRAAGSGPDGRILERDVRTAAMAGVSTVEYAVTDTDHEDVPFSNIRGTIARSLRKSLQETAQLTLNASFDAGDLLSCRKEMKQRSMDRVPSVTDFILFAVSRIILMHPRLNAHGLEKAVRLFKTVNLGVAVDTPRGLMVPTLFNAERHALEMIAGESLRLAEACRSGTVDPDLLHGGTFTVTNLGLFGVESFTPIINPPQTAILGVCAPAVRMRTTEEGNLSSYTAIPFSLTFDHRVMDGVEAARFLQTLIDYMESISTHLAE